MQDNYPLNQESDQIMSNTPIDAIDMPNQHNHIKPKNTQNNAEIIKSSQETVSSILASLPDIGLNIFEPSDMAVQRTNTANTTLNETLNTLNQIETSAGHDVKMNRSDRGERHERHERYEGQNRSDKNERNDRQDRNHKQDRIEKTEKIEKIEDIDAQQASLNRRPQHNQNAKNQSRSGSDAQANQPNNQGHQNNQRRQNSNQRQNQQGQQSQQNHVISNLPPMYLTHLKSLHVGELVELAVGLEIENAHRLRKQELMFAVLKKQAKHGATIYGDGTLEVLSDGFGFLRSPETSYLSSPDDIYVSPSQIRRFNLKTGDTIEGEVRVPKDGERYFALVKLDKVNKVHPEMMKNRIMFENLTPLHPNQQLTLEREIKAEENITGRIIDIIAPIGKGQRALLVAPPKAGKTVMLQHIAHSITTNHPDVELFVLLIDERPEEVTEMQRSVKGEVIASTFDEPATRHVQVAEMVIEKAKCLVEMKKDVVILLDSITRLARAYNTVAPSSGKVLTGGVDANALQRPKRFFGAARNIEEGGSLTIIATALVETGSKMDEVIYEEFKGTGNLEIILERRLAQRRVYPSTNVARSGTRREELLLKPEISQKVWLLRKLIADMDDLDATEFLIDKLKQTKSNTEFFDSMRRSN
jgi:transcription termination factor Rho